MKPVTKPAGPLKLPAAWTDYGAHFGRDGLLYLAEWRKGFDVHELRAMFFRCQQVRSLQTDLRIAQEALQRAELENVRLERDCAFYRRQCVLEARMGLALARISGEAH